MNKVCLITGAGRGFGRAFAEEAVSRGDFVIAGIRRPTDDEFFRRPDVYTVKMDVTNKEEVEAAVKKGTAHFGHLDVLLNNAGFGMSGAFEETSDEELRRLMETDYYGVVNVTRAVLPIFHKQQKGTILSIASQGGLMGYAGSSAYCSAKFAVVGLMQVLHQELASFGIEAAAVCPGAFRTDFRDSSSMVYPKAKVAAYDGTASHQVQKFLQDNTHNQAGDPHLAAKFLFDFLETGKKLPGRILIGKDCCEQVKDDLKEQIASIESYEEASAKTNFAE